MTAKHEPEVLLGAPHWEIPDSMIEVSAFRVRSYVRVGSHGIRLDIWQHPGENYTVHVYGAGREFTLHNAFIALEDAKAAATVIGRLHARCYNGKPAQKQPVAWEAVAKVITDPDLGQALSKKANEIKDKPRIVELISRFARPGESYTTIPQARRADFLAALTSLKPAQKQPEANVITDPELGQALREKNKEIKDRPRIQALIAEFVRPGESYTMIPAVRRAEFLTKLASLKETPTMPMRGTEGKAKGQQNNERS